MPPESLPALEQLRSRTFSFYPAVRGIEHNEWTVGESTWSEVQVRNRRSEREFWIPRSELGEVSSSDSPVLILGLRRELEFKAGGIYPYRRVVTQMPSTPASRREAPEPAPEPQQRTLPVAHARAVQMLALAVGVALIATATIFLGLAGRLHNPIERWLRPDTSTADQRYIGLGVSASYFEVISKLDAPAEERWISREEDEIQFQLLRYPARRYIVVMMGGSRSEMRYLGTLHDPSRQVLDSALLQRGGDTGPLLRNLPDF